MAVMAFFFFGPHIAFSTDGNMERTLTFYYHSPLLSFALHWISGLR